MQHDESAKKVKSTPLRSDSKLMLMTTQAQMLVYGRHMKSSDNKSVAPIVGLFDFASLLRMIWLGAKQDDPYADLWLLRVHQALQNGGQELLHMSSTLDTLFKKVPAGVEVKVAATKSPMVVPLRFATPYAFSGAYFLCGYDNYVRKVLTARYIGILSAKGSSSEQNRAGKLVRRTFLSATGYRFTGVTRADIANNTTRAVFAARQMGMVPKSILEGTERAPYAPHSRVGQTPAAESEVKHEKTDIEEETKSVQDTAQSG